MVGQSNGSFWKSPSGKEKKNCGCTPSLINRSMKSKMKGEATANPNPRFGLHKRGHGRAK